MTTRPWDSPGLPPRAGGDYCVNHGNSCAFRDDDPTRCPWCHCRWTHLEVHGQQECPAWQRERARSLSRRTVLWLVPDARLCE
jgi:hypothetical protein